MTIDKNTIKNKIVSYAKDIYLINAAGGAMLRKYSLSLKDLYETPRTRDMPKDPNGCSIDYESLLTNTYNFDWRNELKDYLDTGLLVGRKIKQ